MYDYISGVYVFESHMSHMFFSVSRSDGSRSGIKLFGIGFLGLLNFVAVMFMESCLSSLLIRVDLSECIGMSSSFILTSFGCCSVIVVEGGWGFIGELGSGLWVVVVLKWGRNIVLMMG